MGYKKVETLKKAIELISNSCLFYGPSGKVRSDFCGLKTFSLGQLSTLDVNISSGVYFEKVKDTRPMNFNEFIDKWHSLGRPPIRRKIPNNDNTITCVSYKYEQLTIETYGSSITIGQVHDTYKGFSIGRDIVVPFVTACPEEAE